MASSSGSSAFATRIAAAWETVVIQRKRRSQERDRLEPEWVMVGPLSNGSRPVLAEAWPWPRVKLTQGHGGRSLSRTVPTIL